MLNGGKVKTKATKDKQKQGCVCNDKNKDLFFNKSLNLDIEKFLDEMRKLPRGERDQYAVKFIERQTDKEIKELAESTNGRKLLVLILAEMADGFTNDKERKQRDRIMSLVPNDCSKHCNADITEVEVITFLYGGLFLDSLGFFATFPEGGGSKGHTAIIIGEKVYSFEHLLGWKCDDKGDDYIAKNQKERHGVGQVLNISKEDASKINKALDESCGKTKIYGLAGDICTDASARVLSEALKNLEAGWNPQRFVGFLENAKVTSTDQAAVKEHRFYPKQPKLTHEKQILKENIRFKDRGLF